MTSTAHAAAEVAAQARTVATEAAGRSGVHIRPARDLADLQLVCAVVDEIWQPPAGETLLRADFLRALTHVGNYCVLAWDGPRPVGVCVGFLCVEPPGELHSHIAGVTSAATGRAIGRALKLDQRAWALEHFLATVGWTFDPLIRRNAFFNASRLGALVTEYLVDFYGPMNDSINTGQPTDRVTASWPLTSPRVLEICAGRDVARPVAPLFGADAIVLDSADEAPVRHDVDPATAVRLVRVPADIEALRRADPELGREWRLAVRETLGTLLNQGWVVTEFGRDGYYVLERGAQHSEEAIA